VTRKGKRYKVTATIRYSCASLLLANGVPLKQIQDWLGHSDYAITANIHAHLDFSAKKETAEAITWLGNTFLATVEEMDTELVANI